jgi:hypothetical protein
LVVVLGPAVVVEAETTFVVEETTWVGAVDVEPPWFEADGEGVEAGTVLTEVEDSVA